VFISDRDGKKIYEVDLIIARTPFKDNQSFYIYTINNIEVIEELTADKLAESIKNPVKDHIYNGIQYETLYTLLQNEYGVAKVLCKEITSLIIIKLDLYTTKDQVYFTANDLAESILKSIKGHIHNGIQYETLYTLLQNEYGVAESICEEIIGLIFIKLDLHTTKDQVYFTANDLAESILKSIRGHIYDRMAQETLCILLQNEYGVAENQSKKIMKLIIKKLNMYSTKDKYIYTERPA
jgi:hypothetical protein